MRETYSGHCTHMSTATGFPSTICHDVPQIRAYGRNNTENSRVDLPTTIADDVDDNFLLAVLTSRLATIVTQMGHIFNDAPHNPCKRAVALVIHGHGDEKLGLAGADHGGHDGR